MCPGFRISAVWDLGKRDEMCILFAYSKMGGRNLTLAVCCIYDIKIPTTA